MTFFLAWVTFTAAVLTLLVGAAAVTLPLLHAYLKIERYLNLTAWWWGTERKP